MRRALSVSARALLACGLLAGAPGRAEPPASGRLLRDIENLRVVGSVLYVAAHPDDENTALLSWFANQRGLRTTYLSLTRGGGGQNLVGSEQSELLGVVRTGELLAARTIDGAEQRFTRLRDFGYSKSAEESLAFWGHDEALADVVRVIEELRPDVVVTRFPTEGPTHGHHLASARLAVEAFEVAAWKPLRVVRNVSTWTLPDDTDTSAWLTVDIGGWDPLLGLSAGEIAATSRTMHKSQGFGAAPRVGPLVEHFEWLAGAPLDPKGDLFDGVSTGLDRFPGTRRLDRALQLAADRFDPRAPHTVLPHLARAHALLDDLPDETWRERLRQELERVMAECAGLWLTARTDRAAVTPGGTLEVRLTALARAPAEVVLRGVRLEPGGAVDGAPLSPGRPWSATVPLQVPTDHPLTIPHWLAEPPTAARYTVSEPARRTAPDTEASLQVAFDLTVAGRELTLRRPVDHAWTDPVHGERRHPVEVLPPATASFDAAALVIPRGDETTARLVLRATSEPTAATLRLVAPPGVTVEPTVLPVDLAPGREHVVEVRLRARPDAGPGTVEAHLDVGGTTWSHRQDVVDLPHLPRRTVLRPSSLAVAPIDLDRGPVHRIGYLPGSGDEVGRALRGLGYEVEEIDEDTVAAGALDRFDAVVLGVRAFNTRPRLLALRDRLDAWVARGGRLLVQYNTNNRFDPLEDSVGPAPLRIGRGRVTDETAAMTPVDPSHPALRTPNRLGSEDFEGWVQERGLYFAESWDEAWQPVFSVADPGEAPQLGSTLVLRHGDGVVVYTGLSFFRQLPAGVPGAHRLLANLLAL